MAWRACNKLNNIWSSKLPWNIKRQLFQATVESVLLYGSETWTITNRTGKSLDGCYTRMLRKALDVSWKAHMSNKELYGDLPKITTSIRKRRLQFAGHCKRGVGKPVSDLLTWNPLHGNDYLDDPLRHSSINYMILALQQQRWKPAWKRGDFEELS